MSQDSFEGEVASLSFYHQPQTIVIGAGAVTIQLDTGKCAFGENFTQDEASRIFWTSLGEDSHVLLKAKIAELEGRLNGAH